MAVYDVSSKPYLLDSLQRIDQSLSPIHIRIQECKDGRQLIFFKDYKKLVEGSSVSLFQVINHHRLDPDMVGLIIEEIDVINNPHYLNDAKHYVNPKKVYIRPMSTKKSRKLCEEALDYFESTGDSSLFDKYVNEDVNFGEKIMSGIKQGGQDALQHQKEKTTSEVKIGASALSQNVLDAREL